MKIKLLSLLLLVGTFTYAHEVTMSCPEAGRVRMNCTDFGGLPYVKITLTAGTWGNGSVDTLFKIGPSFAFVVYAPVPPNQSVEIVFQNTNHSGTANGEVYRVKTPKCTALPLTWGKFTVEDVGVNTVKASITVYDVSQVNRLEFRVRREGTKEWVTKGIVFPAEVKEGKTYTVTFKID